MVFLLVYLNKTIMTQKTIEIFSGCDFPTEEQQEIFNAFVERFGKEPPVHFTFKVLLGTGTVSILDRWYIASDRLQAILFNLEEHDAICIDMFTFDKKEEFIKHIDAHKDQIVANIGNNFTTSTLFTVWDRKNNENPAAFMEIVAAAKDFEVW